LKGGPVRKFGLSQLAMLAPTQALLIVFIALPSLYVLWLSFTESSYGKQAVFIGLENYIAIWNDRYFWRALVNTLIVVNIIVYGELILALVIGSALVKGVPFKRLILAIVLMPYAVSEVVAVVIWKFLLDPDIGALAKALASAGLPDVNWATNPVHGLALVSVISIWLNLPFTLIIIYSAMLAVPDELYESGAIDGANGWQSFRYITLPSVMPAVLVALIFRYIISFRLFGEVWLLTGGGPARTTEVMAIYLYKQSFTYASFGKGSATGWVMVMVSGLIAAAYLYLVYRRGFRGNA
jgi:multiple sugar transport system permease protein